MQAIDATDGEYARLLEADPRHSNAWRMRARIALQNQRSSDAIELLKQGLKHLPSHTSLMGDLANIYLLLRDPVSARPLLEALRNVPDEYPEFTANYTRLLWIEGDYEQALRSFKGALERNPDDQKTATRLAQAYVSLGEGDKAMEFLQSWRHQNPSVEMMALLALCEFDAHGVENALNAALRGIQIQASHPAINHLYAVLLKLSGDSDKAQAYIARVQQDEMSRVQWASFLYAYGSGENVRFHGLSSALLDSAIAQAPVGGLVLEFGVYHGLSLRQLARRIDGPVHGFDSFEGLPMDWKPGEPAGSYSAHGRLPQMPPQVVLHPGWFEDSLPAFVAQQEQKVRLIHIDCDLYSSTRTVLNAMRPLLQIGTILLFDEYLGYPGYEQHEFRAWHEFTKTFGIAFEYTGFNLMAKKAVVRVTNI